MIPVSDRVRQLLIQACDSELKQLQIEAAMPQVDNSGNMSDEEYATCIKEYECVHDDLLENRLVIFDTRPQCNHVDHKQTPAIRCEAEGRYQPIIFAFLPNVDRPLAQLEVQPVMRVCSQHATARVNDYLTKPQWREIQASVMKQAQQMVHFGDARVMYMDHHAKTIVPPPNPDVQLVDVSGHDVIN